MRREQDTAIEGFMEQRVAHRSEDMASVFAGLLDLAMWIDRERFLGAEHYQRTAQWRGYAKWGQARSDRYPGRHGHRKCAETRRSRRALLSAIAGARTLILVRGDADGGRDVTQRDVLQLSKSSKRATGWVDEAPSHAATPSLYAQVRMELKRTPKRRLQNGGESFYVIEITKDRKPNLSIS